jgi:hypothetical protein
MFNAPQRFGLLAVQFEVMALDLNECQNPKQRQELLKGMMYVIDEINNFIANEHSLLDSKPESTAPPYPPVSKVAHQ